MVRATRSTRKNCPHELCTVHVGNMKLGDHMRAEIVPADGPAQRLILRTWDDAGHRGAYMLRCTRSRVGGKVRIHWSGPLSLPSKPRAAHAAAVQRARMFVRTGELVTR